MKWIKCSENLPEIHKSILVTDGANIWVSYRLNPDIIPTCKTPYFPCACCNSCPEWSTDITHWMLLPIPPSDQQADSPA